MRTPEDAVSLRTALEKDEIKRAVVVGGGFIGLEVAENLLSRGVRVSVLDMAEHVLPGFDPEICEYVENHLADRGLMTFSSTKLEAISGEGKVEKVHTSQRVMKADAVILSIGIRANTGFLADSGLALAPNRTVMVNEYLETNDPDIYAVGDCACVTNRITKQPAWSPMGSSANLEGRLAAINLAGGREAYAGPLGTGVVRLPELNAGRTGLTEAAAKEAGFDVETVVAVTDDKAHYYPGASFFIIKLVADRKTERLLGLQALGKGAVDKLVDIAVTAIGLGGRLSELRDLDFAYAPPFSTAIHPFAHAVNILLNKMSGQLTSMTPADYLSCGGEGVSDY